MYEPYLNRIDNRNIFYCKFFPYQLLLCSKTMLNIDPQHFTALLSMCCILSDLCRLQNQSHLAAGWSWVMWSAGTAGAWWLVTLYLAPPVSNAAVDFRIETHNVNKYEIHDLHKICSRRVARVVLHSLLCFNYELILMFCESKKYFILCIIIQRRHWY